MIVAIGVDLIEIARIAETFARQGERFQKRVFTAAEVEYCESLAAKFESYAARFAAKEAVMKALGTGWADGVAWRDIEVAREQNGRPIVTLSGRALERMKELGATRIHLSLSHSQTTAIAQVVLES